MVRRNGYSMMELLVALAVTAILARMAMPDILASSRRFALRAIAGRVRMVLEEVRGESEMLNRGRAVKFIRVENGWRYAVYEDGDADGVRNDDIASGVDRIVRGPLVMLDDSGGFRIGVPAAGVPHPDSGALITSTDSPVNFNASTLCSFAPNGDGTPGTVYLTDGQQTAGVRCSGNEGKISVLLYDLEQQRWIR